MPTVDTCVQQLPGSCVMSCYVCGLTGFSTGARNQETSHCQVWHGRTTAVSAHLHHLVSTCAFLAVGNDLCARSPS